MSTLRTLSLTENQLSAVPDEIWDLTNLEVLALNFNQLSVFSVEVGRLTKLTRLAVQNNPIDGNLPHSLTNLTSLNFFAFYATNLCVPSDAAFRSWLTGVDVVQGTGFTCTPTATEDAAELPSEYKLSPNYPNPFNPSTRIRYALPRRSSVHLTVFDALGRLVRVLREGEQAAGWHEVLFDAEGLPSGVYFYRLEAGSFRETGQMLLVR